MASRAVLEAATCSGVAASVSEACSRSSTSQHTCRLASMSAQKFSSTAFSLQKLVQPQRLRHTQSRQRTSKVSAIAAPDAPAIGQQPGHDDSDYIVLGLAHCFTKDESAKLQDCFVIEAVPAGALECMENGGVTCYKHAWGTTLGVALKQDVSLLPPEFQGARFCEDFDFRTKCSARTWKRAHPQENLMKLVPVGSLRSDWNFNLDDKRILNMVVEVNDNDNIKQDMSIDVYGRNKDEEEPKDEISKLYNA